MVKCIEITPRLFRGLIIIAIAFNVMKISPQDFGLTQAQSSNIQICEQTSFYGEQPVRSAHVWQYQSPSSDVTETYIVENFQGISVCSYSLVDIGRDVVFFQEGSVRQYRRASDARPEFPCTDLLAGDAISEVAVGDNMKVTSSIRTVVPSSPITIIYPTNLLLAPTFVGEFPLLAVADLRPYDGRGFSVNMPLDQIESNIGIAIEDSVDSVELDEIVEYLLTNMPGWELAPQDRTDYPANPYVVIGNRDVYLSFVNPETDDILRVEFNLNVQNKVLQMLVTTPPVKITKAEEIEAIEGSSGNVAAKSSLFKGWAGAEDGPDAVYQGGRIESYTLSDGDQTWFLDLRVDGDDYEVIYSRAVTEASCEPDLFLPEWTTDNDD